VLKSASVWAWQNFRRTGSLTTPKNQDRGEVLARAQDGPIFLVCGSKFPMDHIVRRIVFKRLWDGAILGFELVTYVAWKTGEFIRREACNNLRSLIPFIGLYHVTDRMVKKLIPHYGIYSIQVLQWDEFMEGRGE
jgi:hypothetical protein